MHFNPELSNDLISIEIDQRGMRCIARPRGQAKALLIGAGIVSFSLLLPFLVRRPIDRLIEGRGDGVDVLELVLMALPTVLSLGVVGCIIRRIRRLRGVEILDGTVILHTPDSTVGRHEFELNDLKGATLVSKVGTTTLRIERRRGGGSVPVLLDYEYGVLDNAVDAINRRVIDNVYHAFEVIPLAKPAPPREGGTDAL